MVTKEQINEFALACTEMRQTYFSINHAKALECNPDMAKFKVIFGKKYAKLITEGSAWAFVDLNNGDIYKPAGFNTPAKHSRGNISNGIRDVGPYGPAYLR